MVMMLLVMMMLVKMILTIGYWRSPSSFRRRGSGWRQRAFRRAGMPFFRWVSIPKARVCPTRVGFTYTRERRFSGDKRFRGGVGRGVVGCVGRTYPATP